MLPTHALVTIETNILIEPVVFWLLVRATFTKPARVPMAIRTLEGRRRWLGGCPPSYLTDGRQFSKNSLLYSPPLNTSHATRTVRARQPSPRRQFFPMAFFPTEISSRLVPSRLMLIRRCSDPAMVWGSNGAFSDPIHGFKLMRLHFRKKRPTRPSVEAEPLARAFWPKRNIAPDFHSCAAIHQHVT